MGLLTFSPFATPRTKILRFASWSFKVYESEDDEDCESMAGRECGGWIAVVAPDDEVLIGTIAALSEDSQSRIASRRRVR